MQEGGAARSVGQGAASRARFSAFHASNDSALRAGAGAASSSSDEKHAQDSSDGTHALRSPLLYPCVVHVMCYERDWGSLVFVQRGLLHEEFCNLNWAVARKTFGHAIE